MITAGQFKKGIVITFEGAHWAVEDYHVQKTAQRHPMLHTRLRHLKTGHVVERSYDEAAEPSTGGHTQVPKEARLACGLVIKVPQFIKVGEHVRVDTATHKYLGKEALPRH